MNYRHAYHAGNFADILKHLILVFCLEKLCEKDAPFFVLDTHAGRGRYDLNDENFSKTLEAEAGIKKIIKALKTDSELLPKSFLGILAQTNGCEISELSRRFRFYPGSPLITRNCLRANDRALFCELQRDEFSYLKKSFSGGKNIFFHHEDGLSLLRSKLPPLERRGIILIDPAFEKDQSKISADYDNVVKAMREAYKRFAHGIYVIWYPIIKGDEDVLQKFLRELAEIGFEKVTKIELDVGATGSRPLTKTDATENTSERRLPLQNSKMTESGCFIINAPWQLEEKVNSYLNKILPILQN
jgi:23S rRNA (adenine2030-N6)-methyltransferase